jgi:single-stranded DNA-binding protein
MHCQIYLSGTLASDPQIEQTKKGKDFAKILIETNLVRETRPGEVQSESTVLPVSLFSGPAERVKTLHKGASLTIGTHIVGTRFQPSDGPIKYGCQLVADTIFL